MLQETRYLFCFGLAFQNRYTAYIYRQAYCTYIGYENMIQGTARIELCQEWSTMTIIVMYPPENLQF